MSLGQRVSSLIHIAPYPFIKRFEHNAEEFSKARTLFWYCTFWTSAYLMFLALNILWETKVGIIYYVSAFPLIFGFWLNMLWKSVYFQGLFISIVASLFLFGLAIFQGGFGSPAVTWSYSLVPLAAYAYASNKLVRQLLIIGLVQVVAIFVAHTFEFLPDNTVPPKWRHFNYLNGYFWGGVLSFVFLVLIERDRQRAKAIITKAHEEVLALKNQQDGDYYLTSLLLKPLQSPRINLSFASAEGYVAQKKQFVFRNIQSEIGGDLLIFDELELMGNNYLFFINADAMGKSLQGAGGALVIGALFQARLERSKQGGADEYPEVWLTQAYSEAKALFAGFRGSMLVSAVFGLVASNGCYYYINAEHPEMVLYRDKSANFLRPELDDMLHRKFGTPEDRASVMVKTGRLLPGDCLFGGSDGRDDIREGNGEINSDETLFLRSIESAEGDPEALKQKMLATGDISDDLSYFKLEFKNGTLAKESDATDYRSNRKQIESALKKRDYERAQNLISQLLAGGHETDVMLYYDAQTLFGLRHYREALAVCERLTIRYPQFKPTDDLRTRLKQRLGRQTG